MPRTVSPNMDVSQTKKKFLSYIVKSTPVKDNIMLLDDIFSQVFHIVKEERFS